MKKITLLLFLCLSVLCTLYSQTDNNYIPGYVITQSGDSIAGKILYKGNSSYNDVCIFREEGTDEDKHLKPNDIKLYRYFNGKCYVPLDISINNQPHTVFVEYLLNGIVNIYYYGHLDKYYVKSEAGEILPLSDEEKTTYKNGAYQVYRSKGYVGVLKYVFKNDNNTLKELDNGDIALNQRDLIAVGKKYHNSVCNDRECVIYEKDYDLVKKQEKEIRLQNLSVGVWGGINYGFMPFDEKFINEIDRYIVNIEKNNSVNSYNPYLGVFINYRLFFINPNLDFKYELDYSQQTNKRHLIYESSRENFYNRYDDIEIISKKKILSNTFYLKYNFVKTADHNLYFQGGYSLMYLPYNTYQRKGGYEYRTINTNIIDVSTPEFKLNGIDFMKNGQIKNFVFDNGLSLGFGYQRIYKKIKINGELRYKTIFGNTIKSTTDMSSKNYIPVTFIGHNFALTIGIEFNSLSK